MSWLFSRALAEEYSEENSLDGEQYALLKSNPTPQAYCAPDKMTAFSKLSRFGMTFAPLTENRGEELLTSYLAGFRAKTLAAPEKAQELPENVRDFGKSLPGSLAKYDRATSSWKTAQYSLLGDSESFSETWPRWGTMRNGECWELSTPKRRTEGIESGLWQTPVADDSVNRANGKVNSRGEPKLSAQVKMWPTPQRRDYRSGDEPDSQRSVRKQEQGWSLNLNDAVKLWPTPRTKGMCGGSGAWEQLKENTTIEEDRQMGAGNGGQLNPTWVEWLMGWPLGWTDLKPLETDKYQQWYYSHGKP